MTSLPYIDRPPAHNETVHLRVSNHVNDINDIKFRRNLEKATDSKLRAKEPSCLGGFGTTTVASHQLFTPAGDLPPIPRGKKRSTGILSPKPKPAIILERESSLVAELEAKRKVNTLRKALQRVSSESALQTMAAQKRKDVQTMKREQEDRTGERLAKTFLRRVKPASEEEMNSFAFMLLSGLKWVEPDPRARGWYKLYRKMDIDGDGRISYYELEALIRNVLRFGPDVCSDELMMSVWLAADADKSGSWSSTEFGRMMRKAEDMLKAQEEGRTKGGTDSGSATSNLNPSSPGGSGGGGGAARRKAGGKKKEELSPEMIAIKERAEFASRAALEEIKSSTAKLEAQAERMEKQLTMRARKLKGSVSLPALGGRAGGVAKLGGATGGAVDFLAVETEGQAAGGALPPIS